MRIIYQDKSTVTKEACLLDAVLAFLSKETGNVARVELSLRDFDLLIELIARKGLGDKVIVGNMHVTTQDSHRSDYIVLNDVCFQVNPHTSSRWSSQ